MAIDQLRRRTGIESAEWNNGLLNILAAAFSAFSSRLDAYESIAMEKAMLSTQPHLVVDPTKCPWPCPSCGKGLGEVTPMACKDLCHAWNQCCPTCASKIKSFHGTMRKPNSSSTVPCRDPWHNEEPKL